MGYYQDNHLKFLQELYDKYRDGDKPWVKIADEFNKKFKPPKNKTPENLRATYTYYQGIDLSDGDAFINKIRQNHNTNRKANRIAKENRSILDYLDKIEEVETRLQELIKSIDFKLHPPVKHKKKSTPAPRTLIAHMSDTHYGTNIDKGELAGLNEYNNTIAARRTAYFMKQVGDYKIDHRNDTDLVLVLNGDLAAGVIHNQEGHVDLMTTQFATLLSILGQGISYISQRFNNVTVVCNTGNHMRVMHKADKGRATVQKWDSFATMAYVALQREFKSKYTNVKFIIPESPFAIFEAQGHKIFATHGDTVFDVGNPGKVLKLEDIRKQINEINNSDLTSEDKIKIFLVGHVHTSVYTLMDNGVYVAINGCLSGLDQFANAIKIFGNNPSQQILEVTKDHIGDFRLVTVKEADNDSSLDKIIQPFEGKF